MRSKTQNGELVLFHKNCRPSKLKPFLESGFLFVYLDEDIDFSARRLRIPSERLRFFVNEFHCLARERMVNYLEFIRKEVIDSLPPDIKWLPQISSRNAVSSPFYREYLVICLALNLISQSEKIVVISGQSRIFQAIKANSKHYAHNVRSFGRLWCIFEKGESLLRRLTLPIYFFSKGLLLSRILKKGKSDLIESIPGTVLRTWINKDSMDSTGAYHNRNFGALQSYLESHGKSVAVWPLFYSVARIFDYKQIMSQLGRNGIEVVNPLAWGTLMAHVLHVRDFYRLAFVDYRTKYLDGLDVSSLIQPIARTTSLGFDHYLLTLASRIFSTKVVAPPGGLNLIYPLENNATEHYLNSLLINRVQGINLIGYQNSAWFSELGSMSLLPREDLYFPLPSQILINGKRYRAVFLESGFPESRLKLSTNLRFSEEKYRGLLEKSREVDEREVFLVGNFSENQTIQCVLRCKKILEFRKGFTLKLKLHPLCSPNSVMKRLSQLVHPETIQLFDGNWDEVLSRASLVITPNGSVTNLEVVAAGVPIIRTSNINGLDLDPFWDPVPYFAFADDAEAVWLNYKKWLKFSMGDWEKLRKFGTYILENYFESKNSLNMSRYL